MNGFRSEGVFVLRKRPACYRKRPNERSNVPANKSKALIADAAMVGLRAAGAVAATADPARADDGPGPMGAVYTMTNSPVSNAI